MTLDSRDLEDFLLMTLNTKKNVFGLLYQFLSIFKPVMFDIFCMCHLILT